MGQSREVSSMKLYSTYTYIHVYMFFLNSSNYRGDFILIYIHTYPSVVSYFSNTYIYSIQCVHLCIIFQLYICSICMYTNMHTYTHLCNHNYFLILILCFCISQEWGDIASFLARMWKQKFSRSMRNKELSHLSSPLSSR